LHIDPYCSLIEVYANERRYFNSPFEIVNRIDFFFQIILNFHTVGLDSSAASMLIGPIDGDPIAAPGPFHRQMKERNFLNKVLFLHFRQLVYVARSGG